MIVKNATLLSLFFFFLVVLSFVVNKDEYIR